MPISSEFEILEIINTEWEALSPQHQKLWEIINITPEAWLQNSTAGKDAGGFWAVAILGRLVIWYNDLEKGFNISSYIQYGKICEYLCNQYELRDVLTKLVDSIETGRRPHCGLGPPIPGHFE